MRTLIDQQSEYLILVREWAGTSSMCIEGITRVAYVKLHRQITEASCGAIIEIEIEKRPTNQ